MDIRSPSEIILPPLMQSGGALSPAALAELTRHPRFSDAMRTVMAGNVRLYKGNRIVNYIGNDRGRLIVGLLAYHLHVSRRPDDPTSGLTAHGLKSLCVEQDVCSPGRARALLSLLRLFGYVTPAPAADRRFKLLVPTELLTTSLRERWRAMLDAIALVVPEAAAGRAALERDDFLAAMVRHVVDEYRAGVRPLHVGPELQLFADRNAGLQILFSLILAADLDDTVPPTRPVRISISELARRFAVSRAHVLRLLRDAAAQGLIERNGASEAITLLPPLAHALRQSAALLFLAFAHCVRGALADIAAESPHV